MSLPEEDDAAVLAYLDERGPGQVTLKDITAATGLRGVTVRVCLYSLQGRQLICHAVDRSGWGYGAERYLIEHLHDDPAG